MVVIWLGSCSGFLVELWLFGFAVFACWFGCLMCSWFAVVVCWWVWLDCGWVCCGCYARWVVVLFGCVELLLVLFDWFCLLIVLMRWLFGGCLMCWIVLV